jgi:hypothetical protein
MAPKVHPREGCWSGLAMGLQKCVHQLDIRQVLTYQPVSRYWPLQWSEFGLFVVAAFLLSGFTLWWARRRIG